MLRSTSRRRRVGQLIGQHAWPRTHGATLTLVRTLGPTALVERQRRVRAAVEADARSPARACARPLPASRPGRAGAWVSGHLVEAVTRHANEIGADLVVTGTRGAGFPEVWSPPPRRTHCPALRSACVDGRANLARALPARARAGRLLALERRGDHARPEGRFARRPDPEASDVRPETVRLGARLRAC